MKVEVGGGGEGGREKDVMTPTTTTSEAQSGCDRGTGRSLSAVNTSRLVQDDV